MSWFRPLRTVAAACMLGVTLCAPAAAEETSQYAALIHSFNPKLAHHQTQRLAREVIDDAQRAHLDARLLVALVTVESRWRQSAISSAGARGLGQLMPHTAHVLGVNPRSSTENLRGAATYLARMMREFGDQGQRLRLAIAAYNAGPVAIKRAGGIPSNGETPRYVRKVIAMWHAIQNRVGSAARALPNESTYVVGNVLPVEPYAEIVSIDDLMPQAQTAQNP
jgi:soluble lytic murein transglycosylase-like protein